MNRPKRSWSRYIAGAVRRCLEALGAIAVLGGLLALFAPSLLLGQWWLLGVAALASAGWAVFAQRQKEPVQLFAKENVTIRLVLGDLFEQDASALVGMTTTFDTEPDIIDRSSVQAALLRRVFAGSHARMDEALTNALAAHEPVGTINKQGKQAVYAMGTTAVLQGDGDRRFYCVAYTTMDEDNRARGSISGLLRSLDSAWEAVDRAGSGEAVCVPLIGQGQSRIPELTAETAIRLIAFSFLLRTRRGRFARELRIVVHPSEQNKVDRSEFQAFLHSIANG